MNQLLESYLFLLNEDEVLTEDIRSFLSRLTPYKVKDVRNYLAKALKRKDRNAVSKVISTIPSVSDDTLKYVAKKFTPKFDLAYTLAKRHLTSKYPGIPDRFASYLAVIVGVIAGRESKPDRIANDLLKRFDKNTQKALKGRLTEGDERFATGFGWGFLVSALVTFFIGWAALASTPMITVGIILACFGALMSIAGKVPSEYEA